MPIPQLGRLEQVDLRNIWDSESGSFTPWLAKEENLAMLGDMIGIDLELESQEKWVGPFRADILCKDTATDQWVLIENQLERTDHNHLGQLMTYAAGLEAATIVWIAERFTDEHRAALDWLNEITAEKFNFFGLEMELWRIGGSPIAPKFNIVSKPNDWSRTVTTAATGELSETKQIQREYWGELGKTLIQRHSVVKPQKPLAQHWTNFALGRSHFVLVAFANTQKKRIAVGLVLTGPDAKAHYHLLNKDREIIEKEIGTSLDWEELPGKKESHIMLRRLNSDPTDRSKWQEQDNWLADKLEKFYQVFANRVKNLDADEYTPDGA